MKSGRVFWGTLFVILGLLGILNNFFSLAISWDFLWKLWPLLLVFLGVSAFLKDSKSKWIVIGGIGLLTGVVIFASVQRGCDSVDHIITNIDGDHTPGNYTEQELTFGYDSAAATAKFYFEGGAGHFEMGDTTSSFVSASAKGNVSEYILDYDSEDNIPAFRLHMAEESISWKGNKMRNHVMMRLHPDPLWDLNIDAGAAKIEFDLRAYRIGRLDLDAGAASVKLRLGSRADTSHVKIETGASSVHIFVPTGVGCEFNTESALSSKHINGFANKGDGVYRTDNFDTAKKRIFIFVDSGLSSISVDRYDEETW
ncbi:MAG: hypothetical protein WBQ23_08925 [Bacteroidota bacterium]